MQRKTVLIIIAIFALIPVALMAAGANASTRLQTAQQANASTQSETVGIELIRPASRATTDGVLTLILPDGTAMQHQFDADADPFAATARATLSDGRYAWEIRLTPTLDAATLAELEGARLADAETRSALVSRLMAEGKLPDPDSLMESGAFAVVNGAVADPTLVEESALEDSQTGTQSTEGGNRDQVILDDFIVDGSACFGDDCVDGESFGSDTLRVKENNLRVKFQDTSNSASFPSSDWEITSNDSTNGGRAYLGFTDVDSGRQPFVISAGASQYALFVSTDGRIGLSTSTPLDDLHIVEGDTPTIRLDQDGSQGFTAQVWTMRANEAAFTVRDETSNSVPLRVFAGAPSDSFAIAADGNIGMGFITPTEKLEVDGNVRVHGTVVETSDRRAKENISAIDTNAMLRQLLNIPVYQWNYSRDASDTPHIGPMAQDVFAQTGYGSDTTLAGLDVNGMLIAGVQALHGEIAARDAQIDSLEAQNADLEARLDRLEAALDQLLTEGE